MVCIGEFLGRRRRQNATQLAHASSRVSTGQITGASGTLKGSQWRMWNISPSNPPPPSPPPIRSFPNNKIRYPPIHSAHGGSLRAFLVLVRFALSSLPIRERRWPTRRLSPPGPPGQLLLLPRKLLGKRWCRRSSWRGSLRRSSRRCGHDACACLRCRGAAVPR